MQEGTWAFPTPTPNKVCSVSAHPSLRFDSVSNSQSVLMFMEGTAQEGGSRPAVGEQEGKSWQDRTGRDRRRENVEEETENGGTHARLLKTWCHTRRRWADGLEEDRKMCPSQVQKLSTLKFLIPLPDLKMLIRLKRSDVSVSVQIFGPFFLLIIDSLGTDEENSLSVKNDGHLTNNTFYPV